MGVDFVRSEGEGDDRRGSSYDVDYTNPAFDKKAAPKRRRSLLDFFRATKAPTIKKAPVTTDMNVQSAPVPVTTAPHHRSAQLANERPSHVTEHHEDKNKPKEVIFVPGISAAPQQPVAQAKAPTLTKAPAPVGPAPARPSAPPPPSQPPLSKPPASIPAVPAMPAHTAQAASVRTAPVSAPPPAPVPAPARPAPAVTGAPPTPPDANGQVIIARNVSNIKGVTTQPAAMASGGLEVNLLPGFGANGAAGKSGWIRLVRVVVMTIWCYSLLYALMIAYQGYYVFRNQKTQQELVELTAEIESYRDLQTTVEETNRTLTAIDDVLSHHIYWTNWLAFLEEYTLPDVYYTNFSGNSTGTMSLTAVTTDYNRITQQLNAFRLAGDVVESVTVNTATRSTVTEPTTPAAPEETSEETTVEETVEASAAVTTSAAGLVNFTMTVQVKPELLYYQGIDYATTQKSN